MEGWLVHHGERKQKRVGQVMPSETDSDISIRLSPKRAGRILHFFRMYVNNVLCRLHGRTQEAAAPLPGLHHPTPAEGW